MRKLVILFLLILSISVMVGCNLHNQRYYVAPEQEYSYPQESLPHQSDYNHIYDEYVEADIRVEYIKITSAEAEEMMSDDVIILDVRRPNEFAEGHIPNAVLLPSGELWENATTVLPDKNQVILVYCRAGGRSSVAAQELILLGFTRVYDFGGILDWHGDIVTDRQHP